MGIYHNKWFPRIFYKKPDGGIKSGVTGYFLIEWKPVLSVGVLHFKKGSREAFHSHAFNALTWWIKGGVTEQKINNTKRNYFPSIIPKFTSRNNCHRVVAHKDTYAVTIRGPWVDYWYEIVQGKKIQLTHGRKVVTEEI